MGETQAASLPTPEAGFDHLMENIHGQVFFTKVAAAGFAPENEAQMRSQLELAGKLRQMQQHQQSTKVAADNDPYAQANQSLDNVLEKRGMVNHAAAAHQDELAISEAAARAMQDPGIYNSVLAIKAAEAQAAAEELGLESAPAQA
jgi:hypothetical protein